MSLNKRLELIRVCGIRNVITGTQKYRYYGKLQKEYGFDKWHQSPIELRRYALDISDFVNALSEAGEVEHVCEIGCGLGEIIRRCRARDRYGYDIDPKVIDAAMFLDRESDNKVIFSCSGLSADFAPAQPRIDCLITVNFIHAIDPETLRGIYAHLNNAAAICYLIVDSCSGDDYDYTHDFSTILPAGFKLHKTFGPYNPTRTVEIYKNESFAGR
jgi:SAM-dependent methyltransferase